MKDCLFCKITKGEIPSEKIFENDDLIIIKDINPQAPIHLLIIPKAHFENIKNINKKNASLIAESMEVLGSIYQDLGLKDGFRVAINSGENARQTVYHTHIHVLGGMELSNDMC